MENYPTKVDGISTLPSAEYNNLTSEQKNAVLTSDQALDSLKTDQLAKALAIYSAVGTVYLESGAVNTYLLTTVSPRVSVNDYIYGMEVRFAAINSNTGASTINVNGLGVKDIKLSNGQDLPSGVILAGSLIELIYNGTYFVLYNAGISGVSEFSTGDRKETYKIVADPGWVMMGNGTIGNAASGATERANADTLNLFILLYDNCLDAYCPVSGSRTGNALNDFNANKTLTLPQVLGRASGIWDGTTHQMASATGSETNTLTKANIPPHVHTYEISADLENKSSGGGNVLVANSGANTGNGAADGLLGEAHSIMQPIEYHWVMIKL